MAQEPDDAFQARLASAQAQRDKEKGITAHSNAVGLPSGMGLGFRIGIELVVGLAVGGGVGYLIDRWLGSSPWLTILFFFLCRRHERLSHRQRAWFSYRLSDAARW